MGSNLTTGLAVLVLVVAAGCGDDDAAAPADTTPPAGTAAPGAIEVDLDVEAGSDELPDARRATIRIVDGVVEVSGYVDDGDAVAAVLADGAAVARLVDGPATDVACTEQYGGPDVAHVVGTIDGQAVDTRFHRADGCGIADWDLVQPILPPPIWSSGPDAALGDAAHPVTPAVGDRFTIRLQANPTTGFSWEIELPAGLAVAEDRYEEPDDTDLVGAGGTQVFALLDVGPLVAQADGAVERRGSSGSTAK
jgi:hypothetical protein